LQKNKFQKIGRSTRVSDKKILIVDDSSTNVVLLNAVLAQHGYEVISALNAREAYKLVDKQKPDLILLDLLMPEISGFDFLEKIKKDQSLKDVPVVIVSAIGTKENIRQTKKMGAVHFISKPVNVDEVLNTVSRLLS